MEPGRSYSTTRTVRTCAGSGVSEAHAAELLPAQPAELAEPFHLAQSRGRMISTSLRLLLVIRAARSDEAFWGDALRLHQAIAGEKQGGVGPGVSPKTALAVGLKVDLDALPSGLVDQLKAGKVNLDDPATTLALLKLNSVVGVTGHFDNQGKLVSMGI